MASGATVQLEISQSLPDEEIVRRVLAGEAALFEILMRRYNQRLYRAARAILRDDSEAEDVMQDAYVRAFQHLGQFAGRASFATWLTRIAIHEALARVHRRNRLQPLESSAGAGDFTMRLASHQPDPERQAGNAEMARLLEEAILALPDAYRGVLMLRDVEELTTEEAAAILQITEQNVKVRLHRARAMLRRELFARAGAASSAAFLFPATRCDRVVANVMRRIAEAKAAGQLSW
ncbi:MAG TPA: RNA polymerase sigma factor [Terriglobales bacterium]|nr:RNA polymerase sigma factor [Terriglobales bacterium]